MPEPIVCPACGHEQPPAGVCEKCGIHIKKFLEELAAELLLEGIDEIGEADPAGEVEKKGSAYSKSSMILREFGLDPAKTRMGFKLRIRRIALTFFRLMVTGLIVSPVYAMFLSGAGILWYLYLETHVGKTYFKAFQENAQLIINVLDRNLWFFSAQLTGLAVLVCLGIGVVIRLSFIMRFLYDGRGLFFRFPVWGTLSVFCTCPVIARCFHFNLQTAMILMIFPTLSLFSVCFRLSAYLFPELTITEWIRSIRKMVRYRRMMK